MRGAVLAALFCVIAVPVWADARVTVLMDALRLPQLVQSLRAEGMADADDLNADMLNGQGGAFWSQQVSRLYDTGPMEDTFYRALADGLDDTALDVALQFFDSARGQRITELEIAARDAMREPSVEETAAAAYDALAADNPYAELVSRFIALNDLLELNVALTMSSSYQFSRGLADGGLLEMTDDQILAQVWESEQGLREDAETWLRGYFYLAQQPLDIADLEAYVAFADSPAGADLNAALFAGYEAIFTDIAYGLGRAVAMNAAGNDI
ncbi:DUF2059 domain-containing protein [Roseobacter sinensis]|uniref:DUF2059 domain-containing protein n=1 Tax=Roseobacter sinensis TaxID=2931391 RepID=A0ABT3BET8_9RHOB|nr:DUF2059 domain-containing protein [Roseobacter sp. WL0113]MCV3272096.1 DUF2059 domain-containing protein [Roseobacter sp. WL0113]